MFESNYMRYQHSTSYDSRRAVAGARAILPGSCEEVSPCRGCEHSHQDKDLDEPCCLCVKILRFQGIGKRKQAISCSKLSTGRPRNDGYWEAYFKEVLYLVEAGTPMVGIFKIHPCKYGVGAAMERLGQVHPEHRGYEGRAKRRKKAADIAKWCAKVKPLVKAGMPYRDAVAHVGCPYPKRTINEHMLKIYPEMRQNRGRKK